MRFCIPAQRLEGNGYEQDKYRAILRQTMSITTSDIGRHLVTDGHGNDCLWIVCRPSQFARFLIMRNNDGISNRFSELFAELVPKENQVDLHVWDRHEGRGRS